MKVKKQGKKPIVKKADEKRKPTSVFNGERSKICFFTAEKKRRVEEIMAMPHANRWNAGAKDWDSSEREYAKKIELNRIRNETAWCCSSVDLI